MSSSPPLTSTLVKLQATLWRRTVKGNAAALVMITMISIYSLLGLISMTFALAVGLDQGNQGILPGVVAVGTLAYCIAAIMWPSGEGQLDPASFSTMPVKAKQLIPGFAVSTLMQSRGVTALICTLVTTIVAAIFLPLSTLPLLIIMMAISLVTTLLLGELIASGASGSSSRVSKERMSIFATLGFLVFLLGYNFLISAGGMNQIDALGRFAKWTPVGAGAGVVEAFATQSWWQCALLSGLALLYVVAGVWLWRFLLDNALRAPLDRGGQGNSKTQNQHQKKGDAKVLLLPRVSWSAGGAVFSRALRYIIRDSRLLASLITFPLLGLLFIFQSFTVEFFMIYVGLIMMAAFGGSLATNDFGYDGPATWLHIVSGVKAKTLLLPRHWASMFPGGVMLILYIALTIALAENKTIAVLISSIGVGIYISGAAVALFVTTFNPYPTSKPGTSPWGDRSGYSGAAFIGAFAALLLGWIPTVPAIALGAVGYQSQTTWMLILGEILALVIPVLMYLFIVRSCVSRVEHKMPEIFDKVRSFVK